MPMVYANQPSLKDVLDRPEKYPMKSILIEPVINDSNDCIGLLVEITYKVGHVVRYRYDDEIDLFDKLVQLLAGGIKLV